MPPPVAQLCRAGVPVLRGLLVFVLRTLFVLFVMCPLCPVRSVRNVCPAGVPLCAWCRLSGLPPGAGDRVFLRVAVQLLRLRIAGNDLSAGAGFVPVPIGAVHDVSPGLCTLGDVRQLRAGGRLWL